MFLNNMLIECVNRFRALSLHYKSELKRRCFFLPEVISKQQKFEQVDFPVAWMVFHRKVSTFIKKQNALAN